jgi:hypothetical protein
VIWVRLLSAGTGHWPEPPPPPDADVRLVGVVGSWRSELGSEPPPEAFAGSVGTCRIGAAPCGFAVVVGATEAAGGGIVAPPE